jgi:predicted ATPase
VIGTHGPGANNLPAQLTSFVGRDDELNRVSKLLGESRLVILTGPGGTGKTRLAIEAAARLTDQMPDGVWFVALAPVGDALDVPQAVLSVIGPPDPIWVPDADPVRAVLPPLDRLADMLATRQLVLVLDNCEHLIGAVARLAGRVLPEASGVRILATSREPLGVTGETLCPVPSLPLPPDGATPAEALEYGSVRLLAERGAAVRPGFTVDEVSVEPVIRICRALDGNPLAIELAAARLRSLTPGQVASRLDDRFSLLTAGSRTALPRHQTLRAIVDWSWDLLDERERTVLRRLSVFSGGATPTAAERVCGTAGTPAGLIDVIASLVDKSLVTATGDAEVRYRLLETVRAYAAERLAEAGEEERSGPPAGYSTWPSRASRCRAARSSSLAGRLTAEHDNSRRRAPQRSPPGIPAPDCGWSPPGLFGSCATRGGSWEATRRDMVAVPALPGAGHARSPHPGVISAAAQAEDAPATPLLDTLSSAASIAGPDPRHPLLLIAQPMLAYFTGDRERMQRDLGLLEDHPDPWVRAAQHALRGHLALNVGQVDEAAADLDRGHLAFQAIGDRWGMILCLVGLGEVEMARDHPGEALRILRKARGHAASGLHGNFSDMMLIPMGLARARSGDVDGARADLERGVRIAERIGEHDDEAKGYLARLSWPARVASWTRRGSSWSALADHRALLRRPGMTTVAMSAYSKLGCLLSSRAIQPGRPGGTRRRWAWPPGARDLPAQPSVPGRAGRGFAALAAARGEPGRAAELLGLAHTLHGFRGPASLEVARTAAAATAALGAEAFDAAYAAGRALTRDDAVALVP